MTKPIDSPQRTLEKIRALVENWDEYEDGPDAADFFEQLRPLLGMENPHD